MSEALEISREDGIPTANAAAPRAKKRIVIVGGGFAGMAGAHALRKTQGDIVLIDRRTHNISQPLLYQVATAVLSSAEIAAPIRKLTEDQKNASVLWGEVIAVDLNARCLQVDCN